MKKIINIIIKILVAVGALTFIISGIIGTTSLDFVFGQGMLARIISILVGLVLIYNLKNTKDIV